ncbi:hypothetical protein [Salinisphaera sp. T31B1]|uniref:hypothetical protein n=1 Tax=Salinisphaera sp. T31B1 TaxID=727963 RepID=UPI0033416AA6
MPSTRSCVCVLTGDIVKSSALGADRFDAVMGALESAAETVAAWPQIAPVHYERFRGDGWQLLLGQPKWALRVSLCMRGAIRSACGAGETRLAAGIGSADRADTLAASSGSAFECSGRGLERLKTHQLWWIDGAFATAGERALAQGLFSVCDGLSRHWTSRQAEIFLALVQPEAPTMAALADRLSVQPQTVQVHFARAGGHALLDAVHAFEQALE